MSILNLKDLPVPDDNDLLYIVDINGGYNGKPRTKRITVSNLLKNVENTEGGNQDLTTLTNQVNANSQEITNINSTRSKILWKTSAQRFNLISGTNTLLEIPIPAGTCTEASILQLNLDFGVSNLTGYKLFQIVCGGVFLANFTLSANSWYPITRRIAFVGNLQNPITGNGGGWSPVLNSSVAIVRNFANFELNQTLSIRTSTQNQGDFFEILGGYLELI